MGMLDHDQDEEGNDPLDSGQGLIRDSGVMCRLAMTKLAIQVCSRLAYPEVFVDTSEPQQPKANFESLIEMPASEWDELRQQLVKLLDNLQRGDGKMCPAFDSLDCQMEAMQALAKLRSRLLAVLRKIDDLDDTQREQSATRYSYIRDDVMEYTNSVDVIDEKASGYSPDPSRGSIRSATDARPQTVHDCCEDEIFLDLGRRWD